MTSKKKYAAKVKKPLSERALKRAKERVLIAKDALKWIKAGALKPARGTYVIPGYDVKCKLEKDRYKHKLDNFQLRDIVLGPCAVCAKGALFLAKAVRYDDVSAYNWSDPDHEENFMAMQKHFSISQWNLIEQCFEGWYPRHAYAEKFKTAKDCLMAILQNIIDNNGTFIPFPK